MSEIDTSKAGWLGDELKAAIADAPTKTDQIFRHYAFMRALDHPDKSELQRLLKAVADGKFVRRQTK